MVELPWMAVVGLHALGGLLLAAGALQLSGGLSALVSLGVYVVATVPTALAEIVLTALVFNR